MKLNKLAILAATIALISTAVVKADHIWINEFHYDNTGADTNEFVEIAVRSGTPFNPADFTITLYNQTGGAMYGTAVLTSFTASAPFSIAGSTETITLYTFNFTGTPSGGLQNGPADGISLFNTATSTSIQFISYEGTLTATDGLAVGLTSVDVGVSEPGNALDTSIGYTGSGDRAGNFTYSLITGQTIGGPNNGQMFTAIPEPATYMLFGVGLLVCVQRFRRRREVSNKN